MGLFGGVFLKTISPQEYHSLYNMINGDWLINGKYLMQNWVLSSVVHYI
jgi:hypothetical protein